MTGKYVLYRRGGRLLRRRPRRRTPMFRDTFGSPPVFLRAVPAALAFWLFIGLLAWCR